MRVLAGVSCKTVILYKVQYIITSRCGVFAVSARQMHGDTERRRGGRYGIREITMTFAER